MANTGRTAKLPAAALRPILYALLSERAAQVTQFGLIALPAFHQAVNGVPATQVDGINRADQAKQYA